MSGKKLEVSIVARRLGVSVSTVYRHLDAKNLKSVRVGLKAGIRIYESSVLEFERSREC